MTKLLYDAIRAAFVFVTLHEVPRNLGPFLDHIEQRSNETTRRKQIERFQQELRLEAG